MPLFRANSSTMSKPGDVMTSAADKASFTIKQWVRAIQDGEMPDGREVQGDEAYLNALAAALETLDPTDLDAVMECTGCDIAAAEATAEQLSNLPVRLGGSAVRCKPEVIVYAAGAAPNCDQFLFGFSLADEVFEAATCEAAVVKLTEHERELLKLLRPYTERQQVWAAWKRPQGEAPPIVVMAPRVSHAGIENE